jgi:hypothetical protein
VLRGFSGDDKIARWTQAGRGRRERCSSSGWEKCEEHSPTCEGRRASTTRTWPIAAAAST